jgi:hypothetical protein
MSPLVEQHSHNAQRNYIAQRSNDAQIHEEDQISNEDRVNTLLRDPAGITSLIALVEIDPLTLNSAGRIDYLSALERQAGWLQSLMQNAIVAVAGSQSSRADDIFAGVDDAEREDVALALRLSGGSAQARIDVARIITNHLPATASALAAGEISLAHANVIAKESAQIIEAGAPLDQILEVEKIALAHSEFHTPAQVASKMKATMAKIAPIEYSEAVATATERRYVECYPQPNGMAQIVALLPAPDAQMLMLAIDKLARLNKEHARDEAALRERQISRFSSAAKGANRAPYIDRDAITINRRLEAMRADALAQIASQYLASSAEEGLAHGRPVTLNLTMDLPTMLGLADNPASLKGYGPIPADVARELAADAKWRKFITDPVTGELLDVGRSTYEPPQKLKDFLGARDQICRFPHCRQPARVSDIDHAKAWEDGGETSRTNTGALCRRHHQMKTHGGWKLQSFPDGSCEWSSPAGKNYFVPARQMDESL